MINGLNEALVTPGRRFLYEGTLLKSCRRTFKPRAFFLFSDLLIYAAIGPNTPGKSAKRRRVSAGERG